MNPQFPPRGVFGYFERQYIIGFPLYFVTFSIRPNLTLRNLLLACPYGQYAQAIIPSAAQRCTTEFLSVYR